MLEDHNRRDRANLITLIGRRSNSTPNFALLIGAGASVTSGVKPTCKMIAEWHMQLYNQSKSKEPYDKWVQKQEWYEDEEEYSILFESVCDRPSQRRIYIENCIKNAKPSWGYIYLANIIAHNYFNVIFTPNFDDLLNEACFIYADLRPIVCAHDSAVSGIRITSARPKIVKLHGDFLYDSIKNTMSETETLEDNMREKFKQFAREYGLVVVGYGGHDNSIMDILNTMLRSRDYFPHGLYWCVQNRANVSRKLRRLMQRENAYWVKIEGFDEFMAELHKGLRLTLPDAVRDPYRATTKRLNNFILARKVVKHPIIKDDIMELENQIKRFEQVVSQKKTKAEPELIPHYFLGTREYNRGNFEGALTHLYIALLQVPTDSQEYRNIMGAIADSHLWTEDFEKAIEVSEQLIKRAPHDSHGYTTKAHALAYLGKIKNSIAVLDDAVKNMPEDSKKLYEFILTNRSYAFLVDGNWKDALSDAEKVLQKYPKNYVILVNKCLALQKLGREKGSKKILQNILPEVEEKYTRAMFFALLGDKKNMLKELEAAIKERRTCKVRAKFDIIWADYRQDPEFQKLVPQPPSKR